MPHYFLHSNSCSDREFLSKNHSKMSLFTENREIGKNREIFSIFKFLWNRSICNVKIHFLSKFCLKILIFEEVTSFSVFTNLQGLWPGFTKIAVGTFQKKAVTFEVKQLEPSKFMPNMMHLKVSNYWGSQKILSMCKIENAAGGAKLPPPPR